MNYIIIAFLTILLSNVTLAQNKLLDDMPQSVKAAAGLDKLTTEELQVLSDWINQRAMPANAPTEPSTPRTTSVPQQPKDDIGFKPEVAERGVIQSRLLETKETLRRKIIFVLENGQHWQQTEAKPAFVPKNKEVNISIKQQALGAWSLYINNQNRGIRVKRIK